MFIGRTVAKQTVGHGVCVGTVVSFMTSGYKYCIEYTDGTSAVLTKTALTKLLPLPPVAGTATDVTYAVAAEEDTNNDKATHSNNSRAR